MMMMMMGVFFYLCFLESSLILSFTIQLVITNYHCFGNPYHDSKKE